MSADNHNTDTTATPPIMKISRNGNGDISATILVKDLRPEHVDQIQGELSAALPALSPLNHTSGKPLLTLDFQHINSVSTGAIKELLKMETALKRQSSPSISNPPADMVAALDVMGMGRLLTIKRSQQEVSGAILR